MLDKTTGWVEADITINGQKLTFAEAMALRVAVSSFRMFVCNEATADDLGRQLAAGYDQALSEVEQKMRQRP